MILVWVVMCGSSRFGMFLWVVIVWIVVEVIRYFCRDLFMFWILVFFVCSLVLKLFFRDCFILF